MNRLTVKVFERCAFLPNERGETMNLANKIALVTGAGQGIGKEISLSLAEHGAEVIVSDLAEERVQEVVNIIKGAGGSAECIKLDVSEEKDVNDAFQLIVAKYGTLDIMVNNAGISPKQAFEDITTSDWDRVLAVNLKGTFMCSKKSYELMKEKRYGKIINIASLAGQNGGTVASAHYVASKAAIIGFTKALCKVAAPYNINVNAIAPGRIYTELYYKDIDPKKNEDILKQIPMGHPGTPKDIANAVIFLASCYSDYINGACLNVNGGLFMI
jgi:3-oxoacyl-[acyl-carrier protein] reductase